VLLEIERDIGEVARIKRTVTDGSSTTQAIASGLLIKQSLKQIARASKLHVTKQPKAAGPRLIFCELKRAFPIRIC